MMTILLIASYWFGNFFRIPLSNAVAVSPLDLWVALLFMLQLKSLYFYKDRKHMSMFVPSALFVSALAVSLFVAVIMFDRAQIAVGFLYLMRVAMYMSLLSAHFTVTHERLRVLIIGFVVIGFGQLALYPNLRNLLYLGWDDHYLRLFGSLLDPNFMGVLLGMMSISLLWRYDGKKSTRLDYAVAVLVFSALLLTYSRSAYVVTFIAIATGAIAQKKEKILGLLIVLSVVGILLLPKSLPTEGSNLLRTASISARSEEYVKAIIVARQNLLIGVGFNTYRYARDMYFDEQKSQFQSHSAAGVPNSYLFILATSGIIGLGTFVYWLASLWRAYATHQLGIPLLVAFMLSGLFDNAMFYPFIMCWVFLLLKQTEFVVESHSHDKGNHRVRNTK